MVTPKDQGLESSSVRPIAVDLFSGAGGMSLGFEQSGFDVVAAVEYDPVHAATHLFNFPKCEVLCRDAARLTGSDITGAARKGFNRLHPRSQFPTQIDAIIGGPPCQGFSTGGKRLEDDERNNLILEFVRVVTEVRPKTFCLENVAGFLEVKFEQVREEAFRQLREAGYALSGTETPLNSLHFSVPQMRRRVIILGRLHGEAPSRPIPKDGALSVGDAFEGLPMVSSYEDLLSSDEVLLKRSDRQLRQETKGSYARQLAGLDTVTGDRSRPRLWSPQILTNSRRTVHGRDTINRFKETSPGSVEPKSRLYRLPLDGPSRTLRAGTGAERGAHTSPRPIHPVENRVVTVREAARLHGYPDWFRFHTTNWHGHRQVGNSVPPPLARAAADSLLKSLGRVPSKLRVAAPLGDVSLLSLSRTKAKPVVDALEDELPATRRRLLTPVQEVSSPAFGATRI